MSILNAKGDTNWFFESAASRDKATFNTTKAVPFGSYMKEGTKSFNDHIKDLEETYARNNGIDIKKDMKEMIANPIFMEEYRESVFEPLVQGFRESSPNDPHIESIIENATNSWKHKVKMYNESASITNFLPIATLEFPVLAKQYFTSIINDIIDTRSVETPNLSRHIRTTYMVDNQTGEEYEYPKCLFDGTWQKAFLASQGHPIKDTVVTLTNGRLYKYDIVGSLTDGTSGIDKLAMDVRIIKIQVGAELITLPGNAITVEFSTGGTFVNGDLDFTSSAGTVIADTLSGRINFETGTVDMSSASGQVTGVVFAGHLSNEKNTRALSVREKRDILRYTIRDGQRFNMPFSIEEIEDASALLDINYYNRMVDEIVKCQEINESLSVIKFLEDEFKKYNGVKTDIYKLESVASTYTVDIKPDPQFAGDPFKFVSSAIQFKLRSILTKMSDDLKLDDLSFVISGNPMATHLVSEYIEWKSEKGSSIGGLKVNNSYGFVTDLGMTVRVVASNIFDAYTPEPVTDGIGATNKRELIVNITGFPTDEEHISFQHLKYTSHLFTSQSQTAYQSVNSPGGAYNIVTALSRYLTIAVQGIQSKLIFLNSDIIYGTAPSIPPIVGAPWTEPTPVPPTP